MSLVVMGLSHRSAPMGVLERAALDPAAVDALGATLLAGDHVAEAVVLATCNRLEVYAEAVTFHGAVDGIGAAVAQATGLSLADLTEHLYVHYEDRAVAHAFTVACGLDSMAVGEPQILGQLRGALECARANGAVGSTLNGLFQQALRVGKRAHAETGLDRVGASLVGAGLDAARERLGDLTRRRALVVGAGSMSALAATTLVREGVTDLVVVNRTLAKAEHLAGTLGASVEPWESLPAALASADLVVTCTGAVGHVITPDLMAGVARPVGQVIVDLALPRDVDPEVDAAPGVQVFPLAELGDRLSRRAEAGDGASDLQAVRDLVTSEVAAYLVSARAQRVAPTVAALRARAAQVVDAELGRLDTRLPFLDDADRSEVSRTVHRIVEKLLHTPTVRVKEFAGRDEGGDYARALRELFDLDAREVATVSTPPDPLGRA